MSELLALGRRSALLLLVFALLGGAATGGINLLLPVRFESTAKVMVAAPYWNDSTAIADPNYGDKSLAYGDQFTQQRMASYAVLLKSSMVTDAVSRQLNGELSPEQVAEEIRIRVVPDTVVMEVTAADASPTKAARLADVAAGQLITAIKEMERPPSVVSSPVQPVLVEAGTVPNRPVSPRTLLNITCGLALGLLVGLTFCYVRYSRRLAQLGVPAAGDPGPPPLALLTEQPYGAVDLDVQLLRVEIDSALTDVPRPIIVVTSPRSTAAAMDSAMRLAAARNQSRQPTVVVAAAFGADADASPGLGDVLDGHASAGDVVRRDDGRQVDWIGPGTRPANVTVAITGEPMDRLLAHLETTYSCVLIVSAPVLESVDAVDLGAFAAATVLVAPVRTTSPQEVLESERLLGLGRARYLGRVAYAAQSAQQLGILT